MGGPHFREPIVKRAAYPALAPGEGASKAGPEGLTVRIAGALLLVSACWTNDWERSQIVGNVTQFVLPNVSIDDFVFGVAAIGQDGHESLISAYVSSPRPAIEVKVTK